MARKEITIDIRDGDQARIGAAITRHERNTIHRMLSVSNNSNCH